MILCFHDIGYQVTPYCITPAKFEQIIRENPEAEIHFDDGRSGVLEYAVPILEKLKRKATIFVVPNYIMGFQVPKNEKYSKFLTRKELIDLSITGYEIGSHTMSHIYLRFCTDEALKKELEFSKKWIEHTFQIEVTKFSYPFGDVTEPIKKAAEKVYEKCYTLKSHLGIRRDMILANA